MSTHTPGPWLTRAQGVMSGSEDRLYGANDRIIGTIARHGGGMVLRQRGAVLRKTYASHATEEDKANARLIAAAPDLLEALKLAMPILEGANAKCTNETVFIQTMRAAIAKAEGVS